MQISNCDEFYVNFDAKKIKKEEKKQAVRGKKLEESKKCFINILIAVIFKLSTL